MNFAIAKFIPFRMTPEPKKGRRSVPLQTSIILISPDPGSDNKRSSANIYGILHFVDYCYAIIDSVQNDTVVEQRSLKIHLGRISGIDALEAAFYRAIVSDDRII